MGFDPTISPSPMGNVMNLIQHSHSHEIFVKKSSTISETAKSSCFTDKLKWEDWNPLFLNFLQCIPGRNGILLSYVVCSNPLPDLTPHVDFLDDYVAMRSLTGVSSKADIAEVHTCIVTFISENDTTESKIQSHTQQSNRRLDYITLKNQYEGVGVNVVDIL